MKKPTYHILVCNSYRIAGDAQGACNKKGATELIQYITEEASDRDLTWLYPAPMFERMRTGPLL
jgi:uncharacterized protein (DUF427 family)